MPKRPHFTNSKIGMGNMEPLYIETFDVLISPPDAIANAPEWSGIGKELLLEEIEGISGLNVDLDVVTLKQSFKGTDRLYKGVVPNGTSVNFTIDFNLNLNDNNQSFVYNAFRKWGDLQYNPLTGATSLKNTYVSPNGISMSVFNKIFEVYRKIEIKNVILDGPIPTFDKKYGPGSLEKMQIKFAGDYFNNDYK